MLKIFSSKSISSFFTKSPTVSKFPLSYNFKKCLKFLNFIPKQNFSLDISAEDLEKHYKKFLETDIRSKIVSNPILNSQTSSSRKVLKDVYIESEDLTLDKLAKKFNIPIEKLEMSYIYVNDPRNKSQTTSLECKILIEEAKMLGYEYNFKVIPKELKTSQQKKPPTRPPVVTIMGHVDHGKTTLLDSLRNSSIAQSEYGGITQKIGAFHVFTKDRKQITFIDTPGHEAFINMRIRGASSTDLIILVVSAMDGVQQQTIEVIKIAQKTEVPMIVAINKIDVTGANPEEIEAQLYEKAGLGIDVKGGNIPVIHISAKERMNLDLLEELILYEAEQMDLRTEPNQLSEGVVIEARKIDDETNSCTVLIQQGTLKVNDFVIIGSELLRVKHMKDDRGKIIKSAGPSFAVELLGVKKLPSSGDVLFAVENEYQGKIIASRRKFQEIDCRPSEQIIEGDLSLKIKFTNRKEKKKFYSGDKDFLKEKYDEAEENLEKQLAELKTQENDLSIVGFQNISEEMDKIQLKIDNNKKYVEGMLTTHNPNDKIIKFMLKGPDQGTLETLRVQIHKLSKSYSDVKLQMLSSSVGNVSESDIRCAVHFKCMLFTMDVPISNEAMFLARKEKLIMKSSRLIFGLTDEIKKIIQAENDRVLEDHKMIGTAEVENIFEIKISRTEKRKVAGCMVNHGKINKNNSYRVLRKNKAIANDLTLLNLKKFKNEVNEITQGEECGLAFDKFEDFEPGDLIQAYDFKGHKKGKSYK